MRAAGLILLLLCFPVCVRAGKVLIWPGEFSHWINMKSIVGELSRRGHEITIITNSASPFVGDSAAGEYSVVVLQVPFSKEYITEQLDEMLRYWTYDMADDNIIQVTRKINEMVVAGVENNRAVCKALFSDTELIERLKREKYDVIFSDPISQGYELLAEMLDVPLVLTVRFSFGSVVERWCGQMPAPASYVPAMGIGYTDQMDFTQRVKNTLFYTMHDVIFQLWVTTKWDEYFSEVLAL